MVVLNVTDCESEAIEAEVILVNPVTAIVPVPAPFTVVPAE